MFIIIFLLQKMNIIIGASRCRDLDKLEPLKSDQTVEVWSRGGAKYDDMKDLINQHYIYHHGGAPLIRGQTHFYIVAGLCDITKKLSNRSTNYQEVIYIEPFQETIDRVKSSILKLRSLIISQGSIPIFCTIVPQHLSSWNTSRFDQNKTSQLNYSSSYEHMQTRLMDTTKALNVFLLELNQTLNLSTPCLHRSVMHNQKKGKTYFQHTLLVDGCHASAKVKESWAAGIGGAITRNRKIP